MPAKKLITRLLRKSGRPEVGKSEATSINVSNILKIPITGYPRPAGIRYKVFKN